MTQKFTIKPLRWGRANERFFADVPKGIYLVEYHHADGYRWKSMAEKWTKCSSIESGKAACESHWQSTIMRCLEPADNEPIKRVLSDVLSAIVKSDDAPASANSHIDRALVRLLLMVPGFTTDDPEIQKVIADAKEAMSYYNGILTP